MIDEAFQDQAIALKQAGFNTSVISFETETIYAKPNFAKDEVIVYRGWMLSEKEYNIMLEQTDLMGGKPLVSKEQYYAAHHLPNWYPLVESLTPETLIFPGRDMVAWKTTVAEGWEKIQVKDYVKSLKTAHGSVINNLNELDAVLGDMEFYRGEIEGGICLRRYEDFSPTNERRYFVINGKFYGQDIMFDIRAMEILVRVARVIPSPFFSIDIAERRDGRYRIVEIGDGQVSDLIGWTEQRFAEIWERL